MAHPIANIVIVGGGAGGLELAAMLGEKLGQKNLANIILVNDHLSHIWKPLLHEVAAGTLDSYEDELNYLSLANRHGFYFELGRMVSFDRAAKYITLKTEFDFTDFAIKIKKIFYDYLVIAVGSITHDFNTPGAKEHCFFLDSRSQAELLHQHYLAALMQQESISQSKISIVIIGGGATGVELAAELYYAAQQFKYYALPNNNGPLVHITIIEAGQRLLSAVPEYISRRISQEFANKGIEVRINQRVEQVFAEGVRLANGELIAATFKIWTAGVKCADYLKDLSLETNHLNQILVKQTLQTTVDDAIFAMGDCAACPQPNSDRPVPPRAQAAHQEAVLLAKSLSRIVKGKKVLPFIYKDYGSLVTLSRYTTVGQLMTQKGLRLGLEGTLARWVYNLLYKHHQSVLLGWWSTFLITIAKWLAKPAKPRLKLH